MWADLHELLEEIELIYRHRYPAFLRVAVGITGHEQLGADPVQDAFVGVVRGRRGLRRRAALEAFIWRSVVNAARPRRTSDSQLGDAPGGRRRLHGQAPGGRGQ